MISIRKSWWAGLALAAFVGCGQEETPPANTTSPTTTTTTPTTPSTSTTDKSGPPIKTESPPIASDATKPQTPPENKNEPGKAENAPDNLPAVEGPKVEPPKPSTPKDEGKKDGDKKDDTKGASAGALSDEEIAEIKKLPAGDQELALKQVVCPVSGDHLGTPEMGMPYKVSAEGKTFFLCCKGCEKEVKKDPKAVIAKLQ